MADCNSCKTNKPDFVTRFDHEGTIALMERQVERLWKIILVLIFLLVGTNCAWLWYESQFETVETTEEIFVDAEQDGVANYIGNDGDIINGEGYSKENN